MSSERRRHERVPTHYLVEVTVPTREEVHEDFCLNLSRGGLFVQTRRPFPLGTAVLLELDLEPIGKIIHAEAEVVWTWPEIPYSKSPPGGGVKFTDLNEDAQRFIEMTVEKQKRARHPQQPPPTANRDLQMKSLLPRPTCSVSGRFTSAWRLRMALSLLWLAHSRGIEIGVRGCG